MTRRQRAAPGEGMLESSWPEGDGRAIDRWRTSGSGPVGSAGAVIQAPPGLATLALRDPAPPGPTWAWHLDARPRPWPGCHLVRDQVRLPQVQAAGDHQGDLARPAPVRRTGPQREGLTRLPGTRSCTSRCGSARDVRHAEPRRPRGPVKGGCTANVGTPACHSSADVAVDCTQPRLPGATQSASGPPTRRRCYVRDLLGRRLVAVADSGGA